MNSTSQLDFHPDTESLNAFAEQALPERERGQIVAHLAECSRCRQVIFLARQAAAEMEVAAAPAARSTGRSWSWLSGWRLAWIPAAALATVAGLAFLVHGRHEETRTEMARVVAPIAPQNEARSANPPLNNRVESRMAPAPASPVVEAPRESKIESAPAVAVSQPIPAMAASPRGAVSKEETVAAAPTMVEPPETVTLAGSKGQILGMAEYKPEPMPGAPRTQSVGAMYSGNATATYAPKAKMDKKAERAEASRRTEARYAGSGGASALQLKKNVMPGSSFDAGAQMPVVQFAAAHETNAAPLPSGLTIVSSVTVENRTLAIDQAGALFLSRDSGSHWESVARQWTGRAVNVSLLPNLNGRSFVAAPSSGAAAVPSQSAEIFELRNDKNLTWVSTDGVIWTAQ